jgi:prevent-host-death family protein
MREIGVRELKQSLSETLKAVGRGEQVRVTVRGKAVADIVPAGVAGDDQLRELVAQGRVVPPSRSRPPRAPRLAKGSTSASALVLAERDVER